MSFQGKSLFGIIMVFGFSFCFAQSNTSDKQGGNSSGFSSPLPDDIRVADYFILYGGRPTDFWDALKDPANNPILNAGLRTADEEDLKRLRIADLQNRLLLLEKVGLVRKKNARYTLAFPAITGPNRALLQKYVTQVSDKMLPSVMENIAQIRPHLSGREEMLYHVLWSDIMDGPLAWNIATAKMKQQIQSGDTATRNKGWLVYPAHPFSCGTNAYDLNYGMIRITWNINAYHPLAINETFSACQKDLFHAIQDDQLLKSDQAISALKRYGLVDETGKVLLYWFPQDSLAAKAYMSLGESFGRQMMNHLDVAHVTRLINAPPGTAFLIAYHEICWQLLQILSEKKILNVPLILAKSGIPSDQAVQLVTFIPRPSYPFLNTPVTDSERAAIQHFNEIKIKILAGEKYLNLSTPVDALLTYMSAAILKDPQAYQEVQSTKNETGKLEFEPGWIAQYQNLCIDRVEPTLKEPAEGDIHPIYVMSQGNTEYSDIEVFIYHNKAWRKLFNNGIPSTDWRLSVDQFKNQLK